MQTDAIAQAGPVAQETPREARGPGRDRHLQIVAALVAAGCLIRLGLIMLGWPETNSDEGFLGLMARHTAFQGEKRIWYPGQNYMGPHEAILGGALFKLFGSSLLTLRIGLLALITLFLVSNYVFARMVYGKTWALITLAFVALGSPYVFARQLSAIGGYAETLFFGSLLMLLASWLVLTYHPHRVLREARWRLAVYTIWGFIAGTALWADLLVAPFVLMAGVALLVYCWRELLRLAAVAAAALGLVVGALPMIYFNLTAQPGQDTLSTLQWVRGNPPEGLSEKLDAVSNAVRLSVPMMTGEPFCGVNELSAIGPTTSGATACTVARAGWGSAYMLLFAVAIVLGLWALWRAWRNRNADGEASLRTLRQQGLHVALLATAVITFYLYAFSHTAVDWPGIHARYLIGFLIATPAIFHPLWLAAVAAGPRVRALRFAGRTVLAALGVFLVVGTGLAYAETPRVQEVNRQDAGLIDALIGRGVQNIYSDYWICGKITFLANEKVICATVNTQLNPGLNRYPQYWDRVSADPKAAYVFSDDPCRTPPDYRCSDPQFVTERNGRYTLPYVEAKARETGKLFEVVHVDGYVIYLPS